jgi:hypothetical protein
MKCYLYCTHPRNNKDFLILGDHNKYVCGSPIVNHGHGQYMETPLNGKICFECECNEAYKYEFSPYEGEYCIDPKMSKEEVERYFKLKDALTTEQLFAYGNGKTLYALHLEKVKNARSLLLDPLDIKRNELFKDKDCTAQFTKAPQSYCYAYHKGMICCTNPRGTIEHPVFCSFKYLVISVRPFWLCKIANGEKDLEIRKSCPKEIKVVACNAQN